MRCQAHCKALVVHLATLTECCLPATTQQLKVRFRPLLHPVPRLSHAGAIIMAKLGLVPVRRGYW